jgi:regulatory protein
MAGWKLNPTWPQNDQKHKQTSARNKVMDYLARRNHSELELRTKLSRDYPQPEIDSAIAFAIESKWLLPPAELSDLVSISLSRKCKGHRFINQYLKLKGLPSVKRELEIEIEKGTQLVRSKLGTKLDVSTGRRLEFTVQKKVFRLLANRGFDDESIREIIKSLTGQAKRD